MKRFLTRASALVAVVALTGTVFALTAGVASAAPTAYAIADGDGGPCQFGTIDLASGAFTAIGAPDDGLCVYDLTVGPDGTVYGILLDTSFGPPDSPWFLQTIDPATGAITSSARIGDAGGPDGNEGGGVAFDADGGMFAEYVPAVLPFDPGNPPCEIASAYCLASLDPAAPGAATTIGPGPSTTTLESLTITCAGDYYVTEALTDGDALSWDAATDDVAPEVILNGGLSSVDPATGATSIVGPYGQVITGHDVDPDNTLWGVGFVVGGPPSTFTIDTATGAATPVAPITNADNGILAIAIDHPCSAPPVPDPVVVVPTFTG